MLANALVFSRFLVSYFADFEWDTNGRIPLAPLERWPGADSCYMGHPSPAARELPLRGAFTRLHIQKIAPSLDGWGQGSILLFQRVDYAVQIVLVLADDLDGVAVIQAHHAQDALGIGNAALHIVDTDIVIALGGSRHDPLYLSKIGNLDLFHHHNDLQT